MSATAPPKKAKAPRKVRWRARAAHTEQLLRSHLARTQVLSTSPPRHLSRSHPHSPLSPSFATLTLSPLIHRSHPHSLLSRSHPHSQLSPSFATLTLSPSCAAEAGLSLSLKTKKKLLVKAVLGSLEFSLSHDRAYTIFLY